MRINIPLFDLEIDKVLDPIAHYLQLEETYFTYRCEEHVEKGIDPENEKYDITHRYYCWEITCLRSQFVGADVCFQANKGSSEFDLWMVELMVVGTSRIEIRCETEKFAFELYDILKQYLMGALDLTQTDR